nr:hypothetical protein [Bradyrhizobium aeschynomenes]
MAGFNQKLLLPIHDALDGTALLLLRLCRNAAGSQLSITLLATFEAKNLSAVGGYRIDANQRQQRLHNDEPATTDRRSLNSAISDKLIDFCSPKTGRFTRFRHGTGQPLRKRDAIRRVTLRILRSYDKRRLSRAFDVSATPRQGCTSSVIKGMHREAACTPRQ